MAVKIIKRRYSDPYTPQADNNPDWLLANVGDWKRAYMEIEAAVEFICSGGSSVSINTTEKTITLMTGDKWADYGFDVGNAIKLVYTKETINGDVVTPLDKEIDLTISQLFGDVLVYEENSDVDDIGYDIIPTDRGTVRIKNVKFYMDKEMEGIRVKYQNIPNADVNTHSLNSIIDSTQNEMLYVGLPSLVDGAWADMLLVGKQSGMSIDYARVKRLGADPTGQPVNYHIPSSTTTLTVQASTYYRSAVSMFVVKDIITATTYKTQSAGPIPITPVDNGTYTSGSSGECFMYNADFNGSRNIDIKINTKIRDYVNHNGGSNNRKLKICLLKYVNGPAMTFQSKTELFTIPVVDSSKGQQFLYDQTITLDVNDGDSYSLVYEYSFTNHTSNGLTRNVKYDTLSGSVSIYEVTTNDDYRKRYAIEIAYMVSSFFGEISDIKNLKIPENLFDGGSLTDNVEVRLFPEWNNPNIVVTNDMAETERLGNTGWFNENFNGLINDFSVTSVQYTDLGGFFVPGLSYGNPTKVKAIISGFEEITTESLFKYGFIWLPADVESYKGLTTPFHKNTKINSTNDDQAFGLGTYGFNYEGYANDEAKMNVSDVKFYKIDSTLYFEATFNPTADFKVFFDGRPADREYAIWLSVSDNGSAENLSNRVSLLLDANTMDFFVPIEGTLPNTTTQFIEHPESDIAAGISVYNGFIEDDILARTYFTLEYGRRLSQVVMGFEVENIATGQLYELERYAANMSAFISDNLGIQQLNFDNIRGYKMPIGFNKNWVKALRNSSADNSLRAGYMLYFGQKIRWEDWLQRNNVPAEFYDVSKPFYGFENNWLDYLRAGSANSHRINYFILFDVIDLDGTTHRYKNTYPITFKGYEENDNITAEHFFYSEDGTLLNIPSGGDNQAGDTDTGRPLGVLLSNQRTRIDIIYTKQTGDFNIDNVYAVTTLEIYKGPGAYEHRQLSSIVVPETDNILIPLDGETKLVAELIASNKVKASCYVDPDRLMPGSKYKITGRIGCFANDRGEPVIDRLFENLFDIKFE